jgi:hypothetical protein
MKLYLRCSKHWKPRQKAKIKIQTNQPNHINFSQLNFSTFSDRQECDEEVKDASTCWHGRTNQDAGSVNSEKIENVESRTIHYKYAKIEQDTIAEDSRRRNVATKDMRAFPGWWKCSILCSSRVNRVFQSQSILPISIPNLPHFAAKNRLHVSMWRPLVPPSQVMSLVSNLQLA